MRFLSYALLASMSLFASAQASFFHDLYNSLTGNMDYQDAGRQYAYYRDLFEPMVSLHQQGSLTDHKAQVKKIVRRAVRQSIQGVHDQLNHASVVNNEPEKEKLQGTIDFARKYPYVYYGQLIDSAVTLLKRIESMNWSDVSAKQMRRLHTKAHQLRINLSTIKQELVNVPGYTTQNQEFSSVSESSNWALGIIAAALLASAAAAHHGH